MRNFSLCKTAIIVALPAFMLMIALTAGASMPVTSSESSAPSKLLAPGTEAPVCRLNGTNGTAWDFPAAGQWNIIVYWSLFCHSCLEEIPEIQHRLASMADVKAFFVSLDTEKMLKALYVKKTSELAPKSHNLFMLAEKSGITLNDDNEYLFGLLMEYNIQGRYPGPSVAEHTGEQVSRFMKKTMEVLKWAEKML